MAYFIKLSYILHADGSIIVTVTHSPSTYTWLGDINCHKTCSLRSMIYVQRVEITLK